MTTTTDKRKESTMRNAFLLTHNPAFWPQPESSHLDHHRKLLRAGTYKGDWSCYTSAIQIGDEVFMIRLGRSIPRGIVGHGVATSGRYWSDLHQSGFIDIAFDWLCLIGPPVIAMADLVAIGSEQHWSPQASGIAIRPDAVGPLRRLWARATTEDRDVRRAA
jgi:hypothetical protein